MPLPGLTRTVLVAAVLALSALVTGGCGRGEGDARAVVLAATTSTQDSGLLDVLIPAFKADTGLSVKTVALGSGQSLALGRRGEVDVVLAHSPEAERELMRSGVAGSRRPVMANDFLMVGPRHDPAGTAGTRPEEALRRIARHGAPFVSRGDESGTHAFELGMWERAGVDPRPPWYQETGQGQSATLRIAAERDGYALTDRATYVATGADDELAVMVDGAPGMDNPYHVIAITPRAGSRVNDAGGRALADWLVGSRAQSLIASHGRREHGRALFEPAAR